MTTYYTVTGAPVSLSRGASSTIRNEFSLIAAGFTSVNTDINAKGAIAGQTWTGTHTFPATTYGVTAAYGSSGTAYATLDYVNAVATNVALPGQGGKTGKYLRTNGTTADWSELGVKGANVASAGTVDLSSADGDFLHITGTTTITAITIPIGAERTVVFDGALTLTNSAALLLPSGANIVTAAGDRMVVRGDTAGANVMSYTLANGRALVATPYGLSAPLAVLAPTSAANLDALNICTSAYDNYLIQYDGILPDVSDILVMRVAVAGVVDSTVGNYGPSSSSFSISNNSGTLAGGNGTSGVVYLLNANDATHMKVMIANSYTQRDAVPTYDAVSTAAGFLRAAAISGFRFLWNNGHNFSATGKIRIYGYNNT